MGNENTKSQGNQGIEGGIITAFRLIVLYWLARFTLRYLLDQARGLPSWLTPWQFLTLLLIDLLLLLFLLSSNIQRRLGWLFLPITLTVATGLLSVEKLWQLWMGTTPDASVGDLLYVFSLQTEFILLLLVVAWQYPFRVAALYTLMITGLQWLLIQRFVTPANRQWALLPEDYVEYALVALLIGYVVTWLMASQRQQRAELATANRRLLKQTATVELLAMTQERNRLARELHDTLAHSLTAVTVQLGAIGQVWKSNPEKARQILAQADHNARTGVQEARRALQALRSAPLEELGLVAALHELAESITQRANVALHWQVDPAIVALPAPIEQALYRIAQEALENVARHAQAQAVTVSLTASTTQDHPIVLCVQDDGIGFEPTQRMTEPTQHTHWGINGIRERVELLGGTFTITSKPGIGTTVCVRLNKEEQP